MFVDLIAPKNSLEIDRLGSLRRIAAGVVCGSYCSEEPLESDRLGSLRRIAAGVVCRSYCSEEPLESIDLAA